MWQKQQQVGSHMACMPLVNLVEWRVCWTKITVIYNLKNVYQTKDIQPWSKSLKSVQVWVIKKSYNCALAHCSCKNTAENFDRHVTDVVMHGQNYFRQELYQRNLKACCGCPGISSNWICGADCWPVSESETEKILASDSPSESPRPPRWFFVSGKVRADFGSAPNIQLPHGFFARTELLALAGVDSLVLVGRKRDRGKLGRPL